MNPFVIELPDDVMRRRGSELQEKLQYYSRVRHLRMRWSRRGVNFLTRNDATF